MFPGKAMMLWQEMRKAECFPEKKGFHNIPKE